MKRYSVIIPTLLIGISAVGLGLYAHNTTQRKLWPSDMLGRMTSIANKPFDSSLVVTPFDENPKYPPMWYQDCSPETHETHKKTVPPRHSEQRGGTVVRVCNWSESKPVSRVLFPCAAIGIYAAVCGKAAYGAPMPRTLGRQLSI